MLQNSPQVLSTALCTNILNFVSIQVFKIISFFLVCISFCIKPSRCVSLEDFLSASLLFFFFGVKKTDENIQLNYSHLFPKLHEYPFPSVNLQKWTSCNNFFPKINLISLEEIRYWLKCKNCCLHEKTSLALICVWHTTYSFPVFSQITLYSGSQRLFTMRQFN